MPAHRSYSSASYNFNVSEGLFDMEPLTSQQLEREGVNLGLPRDTAQPAARQPTAVRKGDPGHIKRPPNAFILFRSDLAQRPDLSEALQRNQRNLNRIAGTVWRSMPAEEKAPWYAKADDARRKHLQRYPNYQYHPDKTAGKKKRERGEDMVKKYAGEEALCRRIAHVLIHGADSGSGYSISPTSPTPSMLSSSSTPPYLSDEAEDDTPTQLPSQYTTNDYGHPQFPAGGPSFTQNPASPPQNPFPWILDRSPSANRDARDHYA